jgi:surface protein
MKLNFVKEGTRWISNFEVTSDFNLHIERDKGGVLFVSQRTTPNGEYDSIKGADFTGVDLIIDYDFTSLVYPKFIKVTCDTEPKYAEVVSIGEHVAITFQSKTVEVTKNGTVDVTPDQGFTALSNVQVKVKVPTEGGGAGEDTPKSKWTGHADVEGLKAIGWTDEDIAYYQENGVNWNEEYDEYHKVTDDNKALYGVLTADNVSDYAKRIVYLPKIDTSEVVRGNYLFKGCSAMVAIPHLDTSKMTSMLEMFNTTSIVCIPKLDTQNVTSMYSMFANCPSLVTIPQLDTKNVTDMGYMFSNCYSLVSIPQLDTANVTNMYYMFQNCYSLVSIPQLDTQNITNMSYMFENCTALVSLPALNTKNVTYFYSAFSYSCSLPAIPSIDLSNDGKGYIDFHGLTSLRTIYINGLKSDISFPESNLLSKESLIHIINNEISTKSIGISLARNAYDRLSSDADVSAALAEHPNVSIYEYSYD